MEVRRIRDVQVLYKIFSLFIQEYLIFGWDCEELECGDVTMKRFCPPEKNARNS